MANWGVSVQPPFSSGSKVPLNDHGAGCVGPWLRKLRPRKKPIKTINTTPDPQGKGRVYLVGAGPGDPGLITVRGRQCLEMADVVLYDGLANAQLLQWASGAECISVGKHGQTPIWTQTQINERLTQLARQGKCVVRLKGGDPAVFARTAEELEVLAAAQIPFEVVPGITAALAAASYAGIPITHRRHASAVAFVTGQQQSGGTPQQIDWEALARFPGTLVFYMGVTTLAEWTGQLLAAGKSPDTPAAIVRRCSWSDQSVCRCTLSQLVEQFQSVGRMRPPVIVIVGEVAALGEDFDWFSSRPLRGCGVLVTRPYGQADALCQGLQQLGADVFWQPTIEIVPPNDMTTLDAAIDRLVDQAAQGITFSSANGVDGFFNRVHQRQLDARALGRVSIAAVGPATDLQLRNWGVRADFMPSDSQAYSAAGLLAELKHTLAGQHWIVTATNRSRDTLAVGLQQLGATVSQALCYETQQVSRLNPDIAAALTAGRIHYVTITSSLIAEASFQLLAEFRQQILPLSLSAAVTERLMQLGWPAVAQAESHTSQALIVALQQASLRQPIVARLSES